MPKSVASINSLVRRYKPSTRIEQITYLPQGVSNENYRVDTAEQSWLVKFYAKPLPHEAIAAQRRLAKQAACPAPLYVDEAHQGAIFHYAPGKVPEQFDVSQAVKCLQLIHAQPCSGPYLDLHAELKRYEHQPFYQAYAQALHQVVTDTKMQPEDMRFCHNDLIRQNIISYLGCWQCIDFEYAQPGDRYFDLAMLSISFSLTEAQQHALLSEYFGSEQRIDWVKFTAMQKLVAALNYFWYRANNTAHRVDEAKLQLDEILNAT
ncbi:MULTISPECIES: phosphotransferase [Pseudoalteromonas]|uniref:Aminoglycoside phosphotransferase domain-containing protein n=1 Tax=Pseudoalteromonas ruthenica TaxID=151081 RepID=A0A0F4PS53_9GAMM|nr:MULTISPECIES: phosphotransferase [Pseudoalteromonas]KJY97934.1 hypothetical protein TW76_09005 [Pseudoalteromonas ruthenica]KJZ01959.1 hypothetical protein TW72_03220 [Pseudoalteromonas ruthenica]MCG7567140.1 phosphotransferase [Pseudoalteromonas sp. CnMc7-15]TMO89336.1 hypothetical protein CWC12_06840 [Pseudoalteromonas ruthenica]TMO94630.1 hypothetical protein CWC13_00245 [Pseudoalteromonas ruthenica]